MARLISNNEGFTVEISARRQDLPKSHSGQAQVTFGEHKATFWVEGVVTEAQAEALAMATLIQLARRGADKTLAAAKPGEKVKLI